MREEHRRKSTNLVHALQIWICHAANSERVTTQRVTYETSRVGVFERCRISRSGRGRISRSGINRCSVPLPSLECRKVRYCPRQERKAQKIVRTRGHLRSWQGKMFFFGRFKVLLNYPRFSLLAWIAVLDRCRIMLITYHVRRHVTHERVMSHRMALNHVSRSTSHHTRRSHVPHRVTCAHGTVKLLLTDRGSR